MSARIISTLGRAIDVIVAGRAVSHLRFAAGVCVLAAVLLMGSAGGAVAVADRDSRGSAAPGHGGTNASRQGSTKASSPVGKGTDTRRKTVQGVTTTPGSGRQRGQQPSTGAKSPKKEPGGTDTKDEKKDSGLAAALPDLVAAVPDLVTAVPNVVAPVSNVMAPGPDVVAHVTDVVAPVTRLVAPAPSVVAPAPDVVAPVTRAVAPAPDVVAPAARAVAPAPDVVAPAARAVAPAPSVVAPVSDVIAPADRHPSVAGAVVALTQPQSELSAFMVVITGEPVENALAGIDGAGLSATVGGPVVGAVSEAGRASSLPRMAPPAPNGVIPKGVRSFFRHVPRDLPVAVSLAALAAVALPAVGGLVILTLTGVRVGYREGKAGFALRAAGIAHFDRRGAGQGAASRRRPTRDHRGGLLPRPAYEAHRRLARPCRRPVLMGVELLGDRGWGWDLLDRCAIDDRRSARSPANNGLMAARSSSASRCMPTTATG
jgi:hypothetical protein